MPTRRPDRITLVEAAKHAKLSRSALQRAATRFERGSTGFETVSYHTERGPVRYTTEQWLEDYLNNRWHPRFPGTSEARQRRWGSVELIEADSMGELWFALEQEAYAGRPYGRYIVVDCNGGSHTEITDELRDAIDDPAAEITEFRCHPGRDGSPTDSPVSIILAAIDRKTETPPRAAIVRRRNLNSA